MRFVKFTADNGDPIYINPESVQRVSRRDVQGGGSLVVMTYGSASARVTEEPEEAARLLEECPPWRHVEPTKLHL